MDRYLCFHLGHFLCVFGLILYAGGVYFISFAVYVRILTLINGFVKLLTIYKNRNIIFLQNIIGSEEYEILSYDYR